MLDFSSSRWNQLSASPGGDGRLAASLLVQIRDGDLSCYDELLHQVCHQFSVAEVAYAVVPHLVALAKAASSTDRLGPLRIIGWVAAGRLTHPQHCPPVPDDLMADFDVAMQEGLRLATNSLLEPDRSTEATQELLGVVAALSGCADIGTLLLLGPHELSCPSCGDPITFTDH